MPDSSINQKVLLLIPAYNEEDRIGPVLRDFVTYARNSYPGKFQLVVVINGCRDNTQGVVEAAAREFPEISSLVFPDPIGKGGALIEGLKLAPQSDFIGYVDADGATGPESFFKLVQECQSAECIVGSRRMPDSIIHQLQPSHRQFASKVFHVIVQALFRMNIKDTQCGAKVMTRHAVETIHSSLQIADMAFDINLLYCLKREGFKVKEVAVEWTDKIGSKVRYFRTSLVMFLSVVRLRLVYSPFYKMLRPLRPLEAQIYKSLKSPPPVPSPRRKPIQSIKSVPPASE